MEKKIELSHRLTALADMVTQGSIVCDVGCDHGFLSIYLVQNHISPKVYAMDVRTGPLSRAREHIGAWGLGDYIETRLSDGLEALRPGEADSMVCAGMGGKLMKKIILQGEKQAGMLRELILQPQSEIPAFRGFLRRSGYKTVEENIIEEEGKFYPCMKVVHGSDVCEDDPLGDRFGSLLLEQRHPVLQSYLLMSRENLTRIRSGLKDNESRRGISRCQEIDEELRQIENALKKYG